jgi:hypothetical protein
MGNVTNADIYNKLIDIEGRLSTVETFAPVVSELQKIVIAGNGTPPMKERMNIVENYIKGCRDADKEKIVEKKDDNKWFKRSVIGVIIAQTIGIVISYIK